MKYQLTLLFATILLFSLASASDDIFKYGQDIDYKKPCIFQGAYCDNSFNCSLTIINPNSSIYSNGDMTWNDAYFNYTIPATSDLGTYKVVMCCTNGLNKNCEPNFTFDITGNGKQNATGGVVVLFVIFFIILAGLTCYLTIYSVGHLMSLDFDLIDLAFDWGLYFAIISLYFLEKFYLGNIEMENYLSWFVSIGGIILVLVPIISFILSITIGSLSKKRMIAMNAPARIKFRRGR